MTEKNRNIAQYWIQSFKIGKGLIDPQVDYLLGHLTKEDLQVTSVELLSDPHARPILLKEYRKVTRFHNYTKSGDDIIANQVRRQINLARSQIIHGSLGMIND
jgi:hypothetical protein